MQFCTEGTMWIAESLQQTGKTFTASKKVEGGRNPTWTQDFCLWIPSKGVWEDKNFKWVIEPIYIYIIKIKIKITMVQVLWGIFDNIHFYLINLF